MARGILISALAAWLALGALQPGPAHASLLAVCADPDTKPGDTLKACQGALRDGDLTPGQRAGVLVNLGVAQAALGRHGDAIRSYTLAIATRPEMEIAYTNRARSHRALDAPEAAMADYSKAIEVAPRSADAWFGRGVLKLTLQDPAGAEEDLDRAVSLDRERTDTLFNRGIARLVQGKDGQAEADFSAVIARDRTDAGAYLNRGRARMRTDIAGARDDFDRAVELAPDWARVWYGRGLFHDALGETEAANQDYLRAYELGMADRALADRVRQITGN